VSLNLENSDLKPIMAWWGTGHGSDAPLQSFRMEDSLASARLFRSVGSWTIQSNPEGSVIEV
jgi:hypothetical protein